MLITLALIHVRITFCFTDDRVTEIIKYYCCRKNDSRTAYELKKLKLDMYHDKYQIVGYEKLKSEEKELFSNMLSDKYLNRLLTLDIVQELKMHKLKQEIGFE